MQRSSTQFHSDRVYNDFRRVFRQLPERKLLIRALGPDFVIEDATESYLAMIGIPRSKVIGKPYFEAFSSGVGKTNGTSHLARAFKTVIATGEPLIQQVFRHDISDPNKPKKMLERYWRTTLYPVKNEAGEVVHILQVSSNATQEIITSRELEEVRQHLEEAQFVGRVGSWTLDIGGDVMIGNDSLAHIYGLNPKKTEQGLPLEKYMQRIHVADRDAVERALQRSIARNQPFDMEYRIGKNNQVRWVIGRGRVFEKDGVKRLSGVTVDVTERRDLQSQVELAKRQDRLNREEANLLHQRNEELEVISRTKDEFVALASHQLRTPATAVKQYVGMVLQGYAGEINVLQNDMLTKAFDSNERQLQIINQILNAARADTGKLVMTTAPVDLVALLNNISEEHRPSIQAHAHSLRVLLPRKSVIAQVDMAYLRMAIENLMSNADKYTSEGGIITLAMKVMRTKVKISVTDTGVGIADTDLDKLFQKFSRIYNPLSIQAGGSGIGLYLAAEIVRLHSGTLEVASKENDGTTFTIVIPLQKQ